MAGELAALLSRALDTGAGVLASVVPASIVAKDELAGFGGRAETPAASAFGGGSGLVAA